MNVKIPKNVWLYRGNSLSLLRFSFKCFHEPRFALLHKDRTHDEATREVATHRATFYSLYPGSDISHHHVLYRCVDGGTPGCQGLGSYRCGRDHGMADGWTGLSGVDGFLYKYILLKYYKIKIKLLK